MASLQGRVAGIALPKLVCDTPGGRGKVPLAVDPIVTPSGITRSADTLTTTTSAGAKTTLLRTFRGEVVPYIDPS
jgi:lysine 2,3-aminomutase